MNTRLKELMLEAGYAAPELAGRALVLADLLIRECAETCYHHSRMAGGPVTDFGFGYQDCGDDIKQTFEVK